LLNKFRISSLSNETDLLTFLFFGYVEIQAFCLLSNLTFGEGTKGKEGESELILVQAEEKIGLIFPLIYSLPKDE